MKNKTKRKYNNPVIKEWWNRNNPEPHRNKNVVKITKNFQKVKENKGGVGFGG